MKIATPKLEIEFDPVEFHGKTYTHLTARTPSYNEKSHGQMDWDMNKLNAKQVYDYNVGLVAVCVGESRDLIEKLPAPVAEAFVEFCTGFSQALPKTGKRQSVN